MENLHSLLCKKVAQLTKVVYQLNCRQEDRDMDLNLLTKTYELELDSLARGCEQKLQDFQNQVKQRASTNQKDLSDALSRVKVLESEKTQFLEKFQLYKKDSEGKLTKQKEAVRARVDQLVNEVEQIRKDSQNSINIARSQNQKELEDIRRKLTDENTELQKKVQFLEKQNQDLKNDLQNEKGKISKFEQDIKQCKQDKILVIQTSEKLQKEAEKRINELDIQNKQAQENVARLLDSIEKLKNESQQFNKSKAQLENEITILKQAESILKIKIQDITEQLSQLKEQNDILKSQLKDSEKTILNKNSEIDHLTHIQNQAEIKLEQLTKQLNDLLAQLEQERANLGSTSENERKLQLSLENARKEAQFFMEKVSKLESDLAKKIQEFENLKLENSKLQNEIKLLKKQIIELEASGANLKQSLIQTNEQMKNIMEQLKQAVAELQAKNLLIDSMNTEKAQLFCEIEKLKKELEELRNNSGSASQNMMDKIKSLELEKEELIQKGKKQSEIISQLTDQLSKLSQDSKLQLAQYKEQLTSLLNKVKEDVSGNIQEMKEKILNLKTLLAQEIAKVDLNKTQEQLIELIQTYLINFQSNSSGALDDLKQQFEKQLLDLKTQISNLTSELDQKSSTISSLENIIKQKDLEVDNLKIQLQKYLAEQNNLNLTIQTLQNQLNTLQSSQGDQSQTIDQLKQQLAEFSAQISDKNTKIEALQKQLNQLTITSENTISQLKEEHEAKVKNQLAKFELQQNQLQEALKSEKQKAEETIYNQQKDIEKLKIELENAQKSGNNQSSEIVKLKENITQLTGKIHDLTTEIGQIHEKNDMKNAELLAKMKQMEKVIQENNHQIQDLESGVKQGKQVIEKQVQEIASLNENLANEKNSVVEKIRQMKRDHVTDLDKQKTAFRQEIAAVTAEFEDKIAEEKNIQEEMKQQHQAELEALNQKIRDLHAQFDGRPARPEDMERIKKLSEMVQIREQELKNIAKQTEWYKRQLLDREESYNKRFNEKSSKVGTMQIPGVPAEAMQRAMKQNDSFSLQPATKSNSQTPSKGGKVKSGSGPGSGLPRLQ